MNILNKTILILFFAFYSQSIIADCGHCFKIVEIKIIYNNGNTEISNLKFYREFILENNEIVPKKNESIRKYFSKKSDTIELIDSIYQLKNISPFINIKDKRKIALKAIKDIYLLGWTTIGGAGNLPYLSSEAIKRITNSNVLLINRKIFDVHDEEYIYTENKLKEDEFNTLINESYNSSDANNLALSRLKINKQKNIFPNKSELNNEFKIYLNKIDKKINSNSEIRINKGIEEYFQLYNANLKKRKQYLQLVLEYLNTKNSTNLENFILKSLKNEFQKKMLLNEIDNKKGIITSVIELIKKIHVFKEDHILNEEFYKILKKENIIVLDVSWD